MPMSKITSSMKKGEIIAFFKIGKKIMEIASFLNIFKSTVGYIIKKHKDTTTEKELSLRGRPSLLNGGDMELILSKVKNEPKISSKK
jgi:transposase